MTNAQYRAILHPRPLRVPTIRRPRRARRPPANAAVLARQRGELLAAPGRTLATGRDFARPGVVIDAPEDMHRLLRFCFNLPEEPTAKPGPYRCPFHTDDEDAGALPPSLHVVRAADRSGRGLLHCYRCGRRWSGPEFLRFVLGDDEDGFAAVAAHLWPEQFQDEALAREEFCRVEAALGRAIMWERGREALAALVENGLVAQPPFGDWGALLYDQLLGCLGRRELPRGMREEVYTVNVLTDAAGIPAALDCYCPAYRPRFRCWLGEERETLFLAPHAGDFADPARGSWSCEDVLTAYHVEAEMRRRPVGASPRFALAVGPR